MFLYLLLPLCLWISRSDARAPSGPWDAFNYAPSSRNVRPTAVHSVHGRVQGSDRLVAPRGGSATLTGNGSYLVLDFGQEVGGTTSLTIDKAMPNSALSLSFTESSEFISPINSDDSCHSVATMDSDGVQRLPSPLAIGTFTQTLGQQRGGFKYLTIVSNSDAPVTISNVTVHTTWMPHWDDLRAYTGYFFARDPEFHDPQFLTKLWYAGAYTVQTNTIDSHQARQQPCPSPHGWANNASGGPVEGPILVDGAKRDRNIWPGDMGISSHTELVALNDLLPTKNALAVMFSTQDPVTGSLQYSGPPINARGSDTYISWSLIGTHNYFLYTGDLDFVRSVWGNYTKALAFLEGQVDSTGLMNVPQAFANDWGRDNGQGYNSAANAVMYRSLVTAADLAAHLGLGDLASAYSSNATSLKSAYNRLLWDNTTGMFRDNPTTTLIPQDGNSLAVLFNVTESPAQNEAISEGLTNFWTDIGPLSPELNDTIIPFVGGFEVQAHFIAGQGERALDLLRRGWGYMLYTDISVQSSLLEGFTRNGSLGYRAAAGYDFDHSYTSHSHGWATGPTPAMTFFVLGLTLTSPQGATWSVAPVLSGLEAAEGGLETGLGWFGVKWKTNDNVLTLRLDVPAGTQGIVKVPGRGQIQVDGKMTSAVAEGEGLDLAGGKHTIVRGL
ncbi:glycoside hydrolase family 78 protein [Lyophyllum atratum]|nr:glycoside hydrolase family 78 protein [Lyophyllum atratum]